jgi:hypothetical protein
MSPLSVSSPSSIDPVPLQTANRVDSTLESLTTGAKKGKKKETLMSSWMGPDYSKLCARGLVERNDLEVVQV